MALQQEKVQYQQDNRKYERIEKNLGLRYGRLETFSQHSFTADGELLDISAGGLRLLTAESVPINTKLMIQIDFPGWQVENGKWVATKNEDDVANLDVVGLVVWKAINNEHPEKFDIGISFAGILG